MTREGTGRGSHWYVRTNEVLVGRCVEECYGRMVESPQTLASLQNATTGIARTMREAT